MIADVLLTKKAYILHISGILKMSIIPFFLGNTPVQLQKITCMYFSGLECALPFFSQFVFAQLFKLKWFLNMKSHPVLTNSISRNNLCSLTDDGVSHLEASWDICTFSFQSVSLPLLSWNRSIFILLQLYFMPFQLYLLCRFLT